MRVCVSVRECRYQKPFGKYRIRRAVPVYIVREVNERVCVCVYVRAVGVASLPARHLPDGSAGGVAAELPSCRADAEHMMLTKMEFVSGTRFLSLWLAMNLVMTIQQHDGRKQGLAEAA